VWDFRGGRRPAGGIGAPRFGPAGHHDGRPRRGHHPGPPRRRHAADQLRDLCRGGPVLRLGEHASRARRGVFWTAAAPPLRAAHSALRVLSISGTWLRSPLAVASFRPPNCGAVLPSLRSLGFVPAHFLSSRSLLSHAVVFLPKGDHPRREFWALDARGYPWPDMNATSLPPESRPAALAAHRVPTQDDVSSMAAALSSQAVAISAQAATISQQANTIQQLQNALNGASGLVNTVNSQGTRLTTAETTLTGVSTAVVAMRPLATGVSLALNQATSDVRHLRSPCWAQRWSRLSAPYNGPSTNRAAPLISRRVLTPPRTPPPPPLRRRQLAGSTRSTPSCAWM